MKRAIIIVILVKSLAPLGEHYVIFLVFLGKVISSWVSGLDYAQAPQLDTYFGRVPVQDMGGSRAGTIWFSIKSLIITFPDLSRIDIKIVISL